MPPCTVNSDCAPGDYCDTVMLFCFSCREICDPWKPMSDFCTQQCPGKVLCVNSLTLSFFPGVQNVVFLEWNRMALEWFRFRLLYLNIQNRYYLIIYLNILNILSLFKYAGFYKVK